MKLKRILNEINNGELYHVTDIKNVNNILDNGFNSTNSGISSENSTEFTYLGTIQTIKSLIKNNINYKYKIIKCQINGKLLNLESKTSDYGAMALIYDKFNIKFNGNQLDRIVDENMVKSILLKNNLVGFSFYDKNNFNKLTYGVISKFVKPLKIE
jgi:hypothetical protein